MVLLFPLRSLRVVFAYLVSDVSKQRIGMKLQLPLKYLLMNAFDAFSCGVLNRYE